MENKKYSNDYFIRSGVKEIRLLRKHFAIEGKGDEVRFADVITPSKIQDFYREYLAIIRPRNLRKEKILPQPDSSILRGLYLGNPDANILLNLIVRHVLYTDQILLTDPFQANMLIDGYINPKTLTRESAITRPEKWVDVIANHSLCLCAIEQWVEQGIVIIIPNFCYYYPEVVIKASNEAIQSGKKDLPSDLFEEFTHQTILRLLISVEPNARESLLDLLFTEGDNKQNHREILEEVLNYEKINPIRFRVSSAYLKKYLDQNDTGTMGNISTGIPSTLAYSIADATGSYLLFESEIINKIVMYMIDQPKINNFENIALAFQSLDFPFLSNVPLNKALELRDKGYLSSFRSYLRDLWAVSSKTENLEDIEKATLPFLDRLKTEYKILEMDWEQIRNELRIKAVSKGITSGISTITAGNINLMLGLAGLGVSLVTAIGDYTEFSHKITKLKQNPLSVLLTIKK